MKTPNTSSQFSASNQAVRYLYESYIQDYKNWVNERVSEMEIVNAKNDARKVFAIVNQLSKQPKPPPQNITADKQGYLLESAERTGG